MYEYIYFRKPITGELVKYTVNPEVQFESSEYPEYKRLAEKTLGLPLSHVMIRVK